MADLGVNIDHVATLRQARGGVEPDPVAAAVLCDLAGADGITVHLREDRRHIQERDVRLLKEVVQTRLNLEMAATSEMASVALDLMPETVTLVPESREELTTEGGLDVVGHRESLRSTIQEIGTRGILVSLFVDPEPEQVKASHRLGAQAVEIHTGPYANARTPEAVEQELGKIQATTRLASKLGLRVHAGHGLNYRNIQRLVKISEIREFNIGHSIVSRAVLIGLERAVREMKTLLRT